MGPNNRRAFLPKLTGWEHQLVKVIIVPKLQNSKLQFFNKCYHWNSDDSLTVFFFPPVCLHDWKHCHSFHCSALNFPFPCWKWNAMETGYAMLRRGKCFSFFGRSQINTRGHRMWFLGPSCARPGAALQRSLRVPSNSGYGVYDSMK